MTFSSWTIVFVLQVEIVIILYDETHNVHIQASPHEASCLKCGVHSCQHHVGRNELDEYEMRVNASTVTQDPPSGQGTAGDHVQYNPAYNP